MTSGMKTTISEYGQINGAYPGTTIATTPSNTDLTVAGQYADAFVGDGNGVITVTLKGAGTVNANIAGGILTLTPPAINTSPTAFEFTCAVTRGIDLKYLPNNFT